MPKLTVNEASSGFTHAFRFDWTDILTTGFLTTGGAANQRVIGSLPPAAIVTNAALVQIVDPAGATDFTIDFGVTASDPDEFLDNGDVDGATKLLYNTGDAFVVTATGASVTLGGYANNTASAVNLIMEFNGTNSSITAGEWAIVWTQLDPTGLIN